MVQSRAEVASADDSFCVASSYRAGPDLRRWTESPHGLTMVSEYPFSRRPSLMGMKMVEGARLFRTFSGSWRFPDVDGRRCEVMFYRFDCRPAWLQSLTHPVGRWDLGRDIGKRLGALGFEYPTIVARAQAEFVG